MSYTDLRDFEPEYVTEIDGLRVQLEKLGGGTVGRLYTGTWRYIVTNAAGEEIARGQDFTTGTEHSHRWVARAVVGVFSYAD